MDKTVRSRFGHDFVIVLVVALPDRRAGGMCSAITVMMLFVLSHKLEQRIRLKSRAVG